MDGLQLRQRPASNISLNSTYRAHGRPINYSSYRQTPHRRPLRSVNENVALLRGPGPLESMLKTTTETGDIGIFSIKPRSSSSAAMYLSPSRSRPQCGETARYPIPSARDYDDNFFYHDHQGLRSNRDTTSEILSLYGSESQHTLPTSVSFSLDDGMRSYSLNTLSSRHAPFHHRFHGPLQSPASSHCLQRPRSPFPYPTRLKRPGVRPASPALGENGDIDYSRMVELERFSQRTVHGSYKATYSHGHRRPPPLSLRADANRSTASLPSRTSPSTYCLGAHNFHARTPTTSWTSRHADRHHDRHHDGSIDQSTRSASLTSIVEMYSRPMDFGDSSRPLHSTSSFYYDYTEEFENQPPSDIERDIPLCPVPQRAGSIRWPMVLRDDSPPAIETADNESDDAKVEEKVIHEGDGELTQQGTVPDSKSCIDEVKTGSASPIDNVAQSQPAVVTDLGIHQNGMPASPDHRMKNDRPASAIVRRASLKAASRGPLNEPEDEVLRELSPNRRTWRNSGAGGNVKDEKRRRRDSKCSLTKLRYSLDPAISEFASILSSFDRVGKSPSPKRDVEAPSTSHNIHEDLNQPDEASGQGHHDTEKWQDRRLSLPTFAEPTPRDQQAYQKGHRRNFAALRISTTAIPPEESIRRVYPDLGKELPILAPEPISPVRHLRVKQSIPYLMKALPPLPREAPAPLSQSKEIAEDVSRACGDVLQTLQEIIDEETRSYDPKTKPLPTPVKENRVSQSSPQKFKIRARTSLAASGDDGPKGPGSVEGAHGRDTPTSRSSPAAAKPRLKLRVSRSQLGQSRGSHIIAGPPRNRLKQCNSLAEVTSYSRIHELDGHSMLCCPVKEQESPSAGEDGNDLLGTEGEKDEEGVAGGVDDEQPRRSLPVSEPSDQFNISYPPMPAKADTTALLEHKERLSETASVSLSPCGQRGLRGKLSMLRLRFGRAQSRILPHTDGASPVPIREEPAALPPLPLAIEMYDSDDVMTEKGRGSGLRHVQNGWRIKRWAHDAKRAVRSYVKKNLDR